MVRVWHIATHTTNIGDGALVQGIQRTMQEDSPVTLKFFNDCLMHYNNYWGSKQYNITLVNRINTESDLLIIGGGGMLDGSRSSGNSGMGFNMPMELLAQIKVPIVFYAVGHNTFTGQFYWNKSKLKSLIEFIDNRKDAIFSVRNDGTRERLFSLIGSSANGVQEIPDPGMYVHCKELSHKNIDNLKTNIIIQLAGDNESARLSSLHWSYVPILGEKVLSRRKRKSLMRIVRTLKEVSTEQNVHFIICPHLLRDLSITGDFYDLLPKKFRRLFFESSAVLCGTSNASTFFELYKHADLIIGMRGHSVICGVGLGTPTIALSSHKKVEGFMRSVGLEDRVINMNEPDTENKLFLLINKLLGSRESESACLQKIRIKCREKTKKFNKNIFNLISENNKNVSEW